MLQVFFLEEIRIEGNKSMSFVLIALPYCLITLLPHVLYQPIHHPRIGSSSTELHHLSYHESHRFHISCFEKI